MKNNFKILILVILGCAFFSTVAQNNNKQGDPVLFVDRNYCVSGDTIWFKVLLPENKTSVGNIVRVQVDRRNQNLIASVAVKCVNNWANGFIHIPDSLSTGQYFVTAFVNAQRNQEFLELESKSLLVYNRFDEHIAEIEIAQSKSNYEIGKSRKFLSINTEKEQYLARDKVSIKVDFDSDIEIANAIVKAALVDPLARETDGKYQFKFQSSNSNIPEFVEHDGLLLSGKVTNNTGIAQEDALVILSIEGEQPYFDYYFLGENGDFHFYLKNAYGRTNLVLQVISNRINEEHIIHLENNFLIGKEILKEQVKVLNHEQTEFINTAINSNFAYKLFNPGISIGQTKFEFPSSISVPFYGEIKNRVIPDEFIDLPDFQEISREILPGVQYRVKNGNTTIRLINNRLNMFFEDEPLRLINDIPIFDNDLFVNLKSSDISFIDIVRSERIYGDLIFKGVLAVSLYDKSNSWLAHQPNVFQFDVSFLQPSIKPNYSMNNDLTETYPDMRQVFLWDIIDMDINDEFEFYLSDRKGDVEITIEGFTFSKEYFKSSKIIKVK